MASNAEKRLIVFDLDGTLNRTDLFSVPAIQQVQQELGFPQLDSATIISSYGAPYDEFMDINFPGGDASTAKAYQDKIPAAEKKYLHLARAYDGIPEMLDCLHQNGCLTAVCSNSNWRYISSALGALHLMEKLDYIQELEKGMSNKGQSLRRLLEKSGIHKAVMVGDTLYDYQAAMDNHLPFIGCRYGFRPHEMQGIAHVVDSPSEIAPLALRLLGE